MNIKIDQNTNHNSSELQDKNSEVNDKEYSGLTTLALFTASPGVQTAQ